VAILAGGLGTRLGKISRNTPKSLIPIAGKPFILLQLELLASQGVKEVVVCLGHLGEDIRCEIEKHNLLDISIEYSYDGSKSLGTGGAVKNALPLLGEMFAVLYGDSYLELEFSLISAYFEEQKNSSLMTFTKNESGFHPSNISKKSGNLIHYDKENILPDMAYIDFGMTFLRARDFNNYCGESSFDLATLLNQLSQESKLVGYEVERKFYEIGSISGIRELEAYLSN
jgi:NDP-sugar pyrophosphorylase family protein